MNNKGYIEIDDKLVVYHHQDKEEESEMCGVLVKQWIKDYREFRKEADRYSMYTFHIHVWDNENHFLLAFGNRIEVEDMPHLQGKGYDVMSAKCLVDIDKENDCYAFLLAPLLNEGVRILKNSRNIMKGYGVISGTAILDLAFWACQYNHPHHYTVDWKPGAEFYDEGAVIIDDKGRLYDLGLNLKSETAQYIWQDTDQMKLRLFGLKKYIPETRNRFDLPPSRVLIPLSAEEKEKLENKRFEKTEAMMERVDKEFAGRNSEKPEDKIPY